MWLSRFLCAHRFRSYKVPGLQWAGKHRRFRPITKHMIRNTENRLALEEENARYLSRPFLTEEEEFAHATVRREKQKADFVLRRRFESCPPHRRMDQHFEHLNIKRKWDS